MKVYRFIDFDELYVLFKTGFVPVYPFSAHEDSDAPTGYWSFWFPQKTNFPGLHKRYVCVEADVDEALVGKGYMRFSGTETVYDWDNLREIPEYYEKKIPECWVGFPVSPSVITVDWTMFKIYLGSFERENMRRSNGVLRLMEERKVASKIREFFSTTGCDEKILPKFCRWITATCKRTKLFEELAPQDITEAGVPA